MSFLFFFNRQTIMQTCKHKKLWSDGEAYGCIDCDFIAIGSSPRKPFVIYPTNDKGKKESSVDFYFRCYFKEDSQNPGEYSGWDDYLGANGLIICDGCNEVCEYDEVDESGDCMSCSDEEEEEEEDV